MYAPKTKLNQENKITTIDLTNVEKPRSYKLGN